MGRPGGRRGFRSPLEAAASAMSPIDTALSGCTLEGKKRQRIEDEGRAYRATSPHLLALAPWRCYHWPCGSRVNHQVAKGKAMAEDADTEFGTCRQLPQDVQPIFRDLCQDVASLHAKWRLYLDLYSDQVAIGLLNHTAMYSFQLIEESLRADLTMSISRLADPAQSCGRTNLSLRTLVEKLRDLPGIEERRKEFDEIYAPLKKHRHRRVAHNDLQAALKPHANPLPNINKTQIDDIVAAAGRLLNHVYRAHVDGELSFQPLTISGAKALLRALKQAKRMDDEEPGRRLRGTV